MRSIVTVALLVMLASCATPRMQGESPHYSNACVTTGPTGEIDAHPILNLDDITTFRASEFTGCPGGRNIIVVSWRGEMTVTNVDLSRNVVRRFFSHFHAGEAISFTELDAISRRGVSTIVFQFAVETPGAI